MADSDLPFGFQTKISVRPADNGFIIWFGGMEFIAKTDKEMLAFIKKYFLDLGEVTHRAVRASG